MAFCARSILTCSVTVCSVLVVPDSTLSDKMTETGPAKVGSLRAQRLNNYSRSPSGIVILVAHDCGYALSRYTCRATRVAADCLDFIAFCRCSTGVALHPLKILVSHLPPPLCREVSHRNLDLKRCRATRGCRSYSCGCRATLCN